MALIIDYLGIMSRGKLSLVQEYMKDQSGTRGRKIKYRV